MSMAEHKTELAWDPEEFEKLWIACNERIVNDLMRDPGIEQIKQEVRNEGHVTAEHQDQFIRKVNEIKNKHIEADFGAPDSEDYMQFLKVWQRWLKLRGTNNPKPENVFEENIHHLMFGSTPDPELFLRDFNINKDV